MCLALTWTAGCADSAPEPAAGRTMLLMLYGELNSQDLTLTISDDGRFLIENRIRFNHEGMDSYFGRLEDPRPHDDPRATRILDHAVLERFKRRARIYRFLPRVDGQRREKELARIESVDEARSCRMQLIVDRSRHVLQFVPTDDAPRDAAGPGNSGDFPSGCEALTGKEQYVFVSFTVVPWDRGDRLMREGSWRD